MMDTPTLQIPRSGGCSRFSKALPAPPPVSNDKPAPVIPRREVPRQLPALSTFPTAKSSITFPPRKDSANNSTMSKTFDSPLPALPPQELVAADPLKQMNSVPRKAIPRKAIPPPSSQLTSTPLNLKRQSSISSFLSAYSSDDGASSDSVHRSSQDSSVTKDSEPSHSPEREAMKQEKRKDFVETVASYSAGNPHEDELANVQQKVGMEQELLPPPPPLKDIDRPTTPRTGLPATPRSGLPLIPISIAAAVDPPKESEATFSPASSLNASPQKREIWRRRASSKSDRHLAITELNIGNLSHGSTVTAHPVVAQPPTQALAPEPSQPLAPPNSVSQQNSDGQRFAEGLPGRNIKPSPSPSSLNENDEMKKLTKPFKSLTTRCGSSGASPISMEAQPPSLPEAKPGLSNPAPVAASEEAPKPDENAAAAPPPPPKDLPTPEYSPESPPKQVGISVTSPASPLSSPDLSAPFPGPQIRHEPSQSSMRSPTAPAPPAMPHPPRDSSKGGYPPGPGTKSPSDNTQQRNLDTAPYETYRPSSSGSNRPAMRNKAEQPFRGPTPPQFNNSHQFRGQPQQRPRNGTMDTVRGPPGKLRSITENHAKNEAEMTEIKTYTYSPEEQARLDDAVALFHRHVPDMEPNSQGIYEAAPIKPNHLNCTANHQHWVRGGNSPYPVRCMTCRVPDREQRRVCTWCGVRVCVPCAELLRKHKNIQDALGVIEREQTAAVFDSEPEETASTDA